ncbi:MAG: TetR/AcrR family transcriptional regulator [Myxococcales bacterium]|nr:TetR/AcrR family transcriptional regulator [Myxococcales bacterium]
MTEDSCQPDVRTRILLEATRLFGERGYDGTSIQAVSEAVGIRRPSLLYHFKSKEDLRNAGLEQMIAYWKDAIPAILTAATSGGDRLDRALTAMVAFFVDDPNRARLLAREMLDRPDAMSALFHEHLRPWTGLLTQYIRMGQGAGSIRADLDPEAWTLAMITGAIGAVAVGGVSSHMLLDSPDTERQIRELVRIAKSSLFTPRQEP